MTQLQISRNSPRYPNCLGEWERSQTIILCWGSTVPKVSCELVLGDWVESLGLGPFPSPKQFRPSRPMIKMPDKCYRCVQRKERSLQQPSLVSFLTEVAFKWSWINRLILRHTLTFMYWESILKIFWTLEIVGDFSFLSLSHSKRPSVYPHA